MSGHYIHKKTSLCTKYMISQHCRNPNYQNISLMYVMYQRLGAAPALGVKIEASLHGKAKASRTYHSSPYKPPHQEEGGTHVSEGGVHDALMYLPFQSCDQRCTSLFTASALSQPQVSNRMKGYKNKTLIKTAV